MASYNNTYNQKQQANFMSPGVAPPAYSPIDPSQLMALQALQQNPNGDQLNLANGADDKKKKGWMSWGPTIPGIGCTFPELGVAAGTGAVLGTAVQLISDNAIEHAKSLQSFPGFQQINGVLGKMSAPKWLAERDFWQYINYYPKYHVPGDATASADKALQAMKGRSLERAVPNFESKLKPHWRLWGKSADSVSSYGKLLQDIQPHAAALQESHALRFFKDLGLQDEAAKEFAKENPESLYQFLEHASQQTKTSGFKNLPEAMQLQHRANAGIYDGLKTQGVKDAAGLKNRLNLKFIDVTKKGNLTAANFNPIVDGLHAKIEFLEKRKKELEAASSKLGKEDAKLLYSLKGLRDRLHGGVKEFLGSTYRDKALLQTQMREAKLGPIGRAYVLAFSHLRSIFGGETMTRGLVTKTEEAAKGGLKGRLPGMILGSLIGAAFIIGPAIHAGNEAKPGEKKASFFENFIGFGIFNMAGWELGRHFMDSTKVVERALGRHSLKHPLGLLSFLPGPVGRFFGGISLAGFVTELSAMFIFGAGFEQLGNWFSHKLFGKPSPPDDQNAKTQAAQSNQLPISANVAGMKAAQQVQASGYGATPPPYPAPMPYSPPAPYPMPQTAYNSYGNTSGYGAPLPAASPPSSGMAGMPKGMPNMASPSPDVQAVLQDPAFQRTTRYLNQMMPNMQQGQQ